MRRRHLRALLIAGVSLGLFSGSAVAKEHERRGGERAQHFERHTREARREHQRAEFRDVRERHARAEARERDARWKHERWERERRTHHVRHDRRPRGWDEGKKVGWDGRGVPPAGYKKGTREHERWRERHTQHTPSGGHRPVLTAGGAQPPAGTHPAPSPTNRVWPTNTSQPQQH